MTSTASYTLMPTPSNLDILFPNPVKGGSSLNFYYSLVNPADQVKVKIFTVANRKIFEDDHLDASGGEHLYSLDWAKVGNIANGLYYVVLYYRSGGQETHQVMKLLVRR